MTQLTHHQGTASGSRTNLGYLNCTGEEAQIRINLFRSNGILLGTVEGTIGPYMHRQGNRIFERVTRDDVADGFALITSPTPGTRITAYASVVDNSTGDPIYIPATAILPQPLDPTMDPRATMHLLFRSLAVVADDLDIEEMIELLQTAGLQVALLELRDAFPDIVTVGPNSFALDYGDEYRLHDGNVVSGRVGAYFADVVIDATTISGLPSFTFDDFRWNHQVPPVDTIFATVDLTVDPEGHVTGTTAFTGTGSTVTKSESVTLDGEAYWNTLLCRRSPSADRSRWRSGTRPTPSLSLRTATGPSTTARSRRDGTPPTPSATPTTTTRNSTSWLWTTPKPGSTRRCGSGSRRSAARASPRRPRGS